MSIVLQSQRLGPPPWPTLDPFLFCVHHVDAYPAGDDALAVPKAARAGRRIGMDFEGKDGFRMYHGQTVPGFPQHPHRGFETVTVARKGYIDHSDSLGATARFGEGDTQWMTAGAGIVHAEMFPLLNQEQSNPAELFQIWLNLPASDKMVDPYFTMLWREDIPVLSSRDAARRQTTTTVVAGALPGAEPPPPPPNSWASRPDANLAIWTLAMEPGAEHVVPAAPPESLRSVYVVEGSLRIEGTDYPAPSMVVVAAQRALSLESAEGCELLVLAGKPIGEPVVQHGPFVMNTAEEIRAAFMDYQRTQFGGWPWPTDDPVHPRGTGRFASHADGRREERS